MIMKKTIRANYSTNPQAQLQGEALVSYKPISYFSSLNLETGIIEDPDNPLFNSSIKDKVFVYSTGKGSTGDIMRMWRAHYNGVGPIAILNTEPDPIHIEGGLLTGIPMLFGFTEDIFTEIQSGDRITLNGLDITIERD